MTYTLIDALMQLVTIRVKTQVDDGEGGNNTTWADGATIRAAITKHESNKIIIAEHADTADVYNITTPIDADDLGLHTVIKDATGKTYRVTSDVRTFPTVMSVRYKRYKAERWEET